VHVHPCSLCCDGGAAGRYVHPGGGAAVAAPRVVRGGAGGEPGHTQVRARGTPESPSLVLDN
jgi:hypothetical protein